jgi:hypothetical protein
MMNVVTSEKSPEVVREDGSGLARKDSTAKVLMMAYIDHDREFPGTFPVKVGYTLKRPVLATQTVSAG